MHMTAIEPGTYREVMGHYPTGVTAVTGVADDGRPTAMVVGTFSSVSLDPPLVSFMPTRNSSTFARLRTAKGYCINVLAHDQVDLCRALARSGEDKLAGVKWTMSPHGAPMLDDAVAYVHCVSHQTVEAGDHYIELCAVTGMEVNRPVTPLLFFQGGYGGFATRSMTARTDGDLVAAVRLGEVARPYIERIARELGCEAEVLVSVGDDELMTVSAAFGGDVPVRERIGERIPLIPPLGEAYVAENHEDVVARWLSRAASQDEKTLAKYRARLDAVRAKGWSMSRRNSEGGVGYGEFVAALQEYSAGPLTPARERAVRAIISEASHLYEVVELNDDEIYDVGSLAVPVHNPEGGISMVLRLMQLPPGASAAKVRSWVNSLKEAAAKTERALRDQHREGLEEYLSWYQSEFPM
jgi:flavin reductase (DIM6/NTAB) family NADH-FMN oxidoreductase RutF/DNA-binding IclR family transcriptional regulator